jgi:AcrR family transcriptional regulator
MEPVKPSTHPAPAGRPRARATRSRITNAAAKLFAERGYTGTTMADIAAAAGVAVQTVYFVFHTKNDVLDSAYSLAVMGDADPTVPQDQAWYRQALAEPDVSIAVEVFVNGLSEIVRRVAPLDFAVRTAAAADPDASAFLARNEGMRAGGYREMVQVLSGKWPLRESVTETQATDVMLFLVGPAAYRALVLDRGWTHAEWAAWTSGALAEQLFDGGARRRQAAPPPRSAIQGEPE